VIKVNGKRRRPALERRSMWRGCSQGSTAKQKVAVERNGEIIPRSGHGSTLLADGDQLEIVVAVAAAEHAGFPRHAGRSYARA